MKSVSAKRYYKRNHRKAMAYFKEYCDYTGIHGFKYIAEDRTLCERILWIISIVFSIICCGLMIHQIIQKYINTPVIVTFSMQETPANEIPFPAVTICPTSKVSQDYFNITETRIMLRNGKNISNEISAMYNAAAAICGLFHRLDSVNSSLDFYRFLYMSKPDFFLGCEYPGLGYFDCTEYFTPTLTDEGLCYTFNILNKRDMFQDNISLHNIQNIHIVNKKTEWDIEEGYDDLTSMQSYPFRPLGYGLKNGLKVYMLYKTTDTKNKVCTTIDGGFKVALHLPSKIPELKESHFILPLNQKVIGQITPHMIKTSAGVKALDPIKRNCYFQSEKSLKFFKIYTQESCMAECKTEFILDACRCVSFHIPRYNETRICMDEKEAWCSHIAETKFIRNSTNVPPSEHNGENPLLNCHCPPVCTDITYDLDISQNTIPADDIFKMRDAYTNKTTRYIYSILLLYFRKQYVETKERNQLYGLSDFVSNFGGLLGLFTGFSMLSLVEIIYFLSLRIWGNAKLYKNWSGKEN